MAKLNFIEKECFEDLFGMGSGYVLDFSNRKFQEFIYEILEIDIYVKYQGLSKAKILREIITTYDDKSVGKLLLNLLQYMQNKNMITEKECFKKCVEIGNRLIGRTITTKVLKQDIEIETESFIVDYEKYLKELVKLTKYEETPQKRGYEFEKYLNNLFTIFSLEPRGSFKIIGEQIDGSFILHKEIYLLEAKWTNKKIDKNGLVIFNEKVSSKSGFTRGVYISFSGYTEEALRTFSQGRTVNIILITVEELAIALTRKMDISDLIWQKVRYLAEEGNCNKSIFEF